MSKLGNKPTAEEAIKLAKRTVSLRGEGRSWPFIEEVTGRSYKTCMKYMRLYQSGGEFKIRKEIRKGQQALEKTHQKARKKDSALDKEFIGQNAFNDIMGISL